MDDIYHSGIDFSDTLDECYWNLEPDGKFSVKSAWNLVRVKKEPVPWGRNIWDANLPTKISFFLWRVYWNRLPTDDKIRQMGFLMPSKCVCCTVCPKSENLKHLLFEGDWAKIVWTWFTKRFYLGAIEERN